MFFPKFPKISPSKNFPLYGTSRFSHLHYRQTYRNRNHCFFRNFKNFSLRKFPAIRYLKVFTSPPQTDIQEPKSLFFPKFPKFLPPKISRYTVPQGFHISTTDRHTGTKIIVCSEISKISPSENFPLYSTSRFSHLHHRQTYRNHGRNNYQ